MPYLISPIAKSRKVILEMICSFIIREILGGPAELLSERTWSPTWRAKVLGALHFSSFPSHEANIPTLTPPAQALNGFNNIAILLSNFYMRLAHVLYARSCISAQSGLTRISNKSLGRYEVIASYFTQASETGVTTSEDERLKQLQDAKRKRRTEWKRRQGVCNL